MALYDLDQDAWLPFGRLSGAARDAFAWTTIGRSRAHAVGANRRPLSPSGRLSRAKMSRAAFLILTAGWLTTVAAVLALVLVLRTLG